MAELLELAGRAMHSIGYAEGLYPAQWTALRYFSRSKEPVRTASSLARFQGLANGPVSRTVRTLLQKQLLKKAKDQPIGRAEHIEVSEKGMALLERDPMQGIVDAIDKLTDGERAALARGLEAAIESASAVWPKDEKPHLPDKSS